MFFKDKSSTEDNVLLVLDIGTSSVKAMIMLIEGEEKQIGRITGIGIKEQKLGDMHNGVVTDIYSVIQNCNFAIREAEKMADIRANNVIIGIAGELVKGITSKASYVRENPNDKITIDELRNIMHKIEWKTFDKVRAQLARDTGHHEIDVKLINASIISVNIDGYKVSNPIGFQGKEITIDIFNSFAPLTHFGALQTISAELNKNLLSIVAQPYAVARSINFEDGGRIGGIFIDIGGGTTDIAVTLDGTLVGTKMFTIGGRTFTKRLAQNLNISFLEAESIKLNYSDNLLEKHSSEIVSEAMKIDSDIWLTGVLLTLNEFEDVEILPSRIFLCGGGSKLPEIKEIMENDKWYKKLPFARKPMISFLQPKLINRIVDDTSIIQGQEFITPMALANIGLELNTEEKLISKLLKKVVSLMQT